MKVLFIDTVHPYLEKKLKQLGFECHHAHKESKAEIKEKIKVYHGIIIRSRFTIDVSFLKNAKNLKFIARAGSGTENINLEYIRKQNIACFTAPEGNSNSVAEHALGMILCLLNNIKKSDEEIRKDVWERENNRGTELNKKTIGIIGYGNTGSAFAKVVEGLGVKILAYDKYKKKFPFESSMQQIFKKADIVSLHIPLNTETLKICNQEFIDKFSKPIYIINTSRGKCIDTKALVSGLKNKTILGVCLDVFEYEEKSFSSLKLKQNSKEMTYLKNSKNTILTPHIAGWTYESKYKIAEVLGRKIEDYFKTK
ncbi:MAG: NAD(P)-dependent oxidoreductase [Bacteroidota bacterium]|nr:NAD(P)-dependent oxidoreductase [Bacteroidota bacterium]